MMLMLDNPSAHLDLFEKYGIDYVFLSNYETSGNSAQAEDFDALFQLIYQSDEAYWYDPVRIYAVSERAIVKFQEHGTKELQ